MGSNTFQVSCTFQGDATAGFLVLPACRQVMARTTDLSEWEQF